jgi:dimethylhistidine N-methyltransferase
MVAREGDLIRAAVAKSQLRKIMTRPTDTNTIDALSAEEEFREAVIEGLSNSPRQLPCKYFYDRRGSALFDRICELDEYYLTRTELAITERYAAEMGEQIGEGVILVEYGSGSSSKTRLLLDNLPEPAAYVPVDISKGHLLQTAEDLRRDYPNLEILPVAADFTSEFSIPQPDNDFTHVAVYFPGSTIGNLCQHEAVELLTSIAKLSGRGGGLLIGIDLDKDPDVLELAYNDREGVTAEFNLNLLHRIRDELGADLDVDGFEHVARYDQDDQRMEIFLRSLRDQVITIDEHSFELTEGELIHTEYSHKYTIDGFADLADRAGLTLRKYWTDDRKYFAVLHLVVTD